VIPLTNRPFIHYQFNHFLEAGIDTVILTLSYRPDVLRSILGDRYKGLSILYTEEPEPRGTGGAIARLTEMASGDFVVTNGDVLCPCRVMDLIEFHRSRENDVSLLLVEVDDPSRFGVVDIDREDRILAFVEKPSLEEAPSHWINGGMYILSSSVIEEIPPDRPSSIEREIFPALIRKGYRVGGFRYQGYWVDVGTVDSYRKVHEDYLDGRWTWQDNVQAGRIDRVQRSFFENPPAEPTLRVYDSIIWSGFNPGRDIRVERSVLADRVTVGDHAFLRGAVVAPDTQIPADAVVEE